MEPNILLLTDSYKPTHWKQLPKGVTILRSYLESRGGKFDNTLFYGLQYIIKDIKGGERTHNKLSLEVFLKQVRRILVG